MHMDYRRRPRSRGDKPCFRARLPDNCDKIDAGYAIPAPQRQMPVFLIVIKETRLRTRANVKS